MIVIYVVILAVVVVFAIQNTAALTIHFLSFDFHMPLSIPIIMSLLIGILIGALYFQVNSYKETRLLKKQIKEAEAKANKTEMENKLLQHQLDENIAMRKGNLDADGRAKISK